MLGHHFLDRRFLEQDLLDYHFLDHDFLDRLFFLFFEDGLDRRDLFPDQDLAERSATVPTESVVGVDLRAACGTIQLFFCDRFEDRLSLDNLFCDNWL